MPLCIAVARERTTGESRVALVPETAKKFKALGASLRMEQSAGTESHFLDSDYADVNMLGGIADAYGGAQLILRVTPPNAEEIAALPEVLECFAVTGEADYVLRIVAPDLAAFSDLMMKKLLTLPGVAQVKTNIALSKVKQTHELPLDHVAQPRQQKRRVKYTG
jgi:NAD/NADP transhydrogenase alpha subunit